MPTARGGKRKTIVDAAPLRSINSDKTDKHNKLTKSNAKERPAKQHPDSISLHDSQQSNKTSHTYKKQVQAPPEMQRDEETRTDEIIDNTEEDDGSDLNDDDSEGLPEAICAKPRTNLLMTVEKSAKRHKQTKDMNGEDSSTNSSHRFR